MKRFRVKGIDVATREPVEFTEFEASSRDDVVARLQKVGIEVRSIDEVPWMDLTPQTRAADVAAAGEQRTLRGDAKTHLTTQRELSAKRLAARKMEREAYDAPRPRVLMDLSWSGFFGIMFAVAFGIPLSAIVTALGIGVLAELGRARVRAAETDGRPVESMPSPIEVVVLAGLIVLVIWLAVRWARQANWFRPRKGEA